MASSKEPNPYQQDEIEIDYDADRSPQPPTQPATSNEQDTSMDEATYQPPPPLPPAQPSNLPQVGRPDTQGASTGQQQLDQLSREELRRVAGLMDIPLPRRQRPAQPAFPQPAFSHPVLPRQHPQAQPAQKQHMPTPNLGQGYAGPPNSIYTCPNCQRRGHPLRECPGPPDRFGYIPGCPKCNRLGHTLARCPRGFTLQDVFHYIFFSRRNNFPMEWDTDLLDPEMGTFLNEAQPWTRGFAMQRMREHLARDWDWHPEGTVPDPAWNLKDTLPPQIHPQAPAKLSRFTPAQMREWAQRRAETARQRNDAEAASRGAGRFSWPSRQHDGARSSSGFSGLARNQPGGQRARGPDPLRRIHNSSRPRVNKPGKTGKSRATENVASKLADIGDQPKLIATKSIGGGSKDPKDWSQLQHQFRDRSRRSSTERIFNGSPGYRAASPQRSMLDNPRGRRARGPAGSQYDDPRRGRRSASPVDTRFDGHRGNHRAASPQYSLLDGPRANRRAASPQHSRFDNRANRANRRTPSPQGSRHDDPRGRGGGSRDNTRSQSNRRRSSPHGRILDDRRANRAASPQASRLDPRGNNRAPSPQHSRYGSPRGRGRSRDDTRSHSYCRRPSPHSPFLDDPRRKESEDCQNCKQPGHHHTRCPQNPKKTEPTRAATQIERSFDTRVNHLPVPAERRDRPEGLCFNCMIPNHAWRECPFPCAICGQHGHSRQHCTKGN